MSMRRRAEGGPVEGRRWAGGGPVVGWRWAGGGPVVGRRWAGGGPAVTMYIFLLYPWAGGHNQLIFGKYHQRYAGPPPNYTLCACVPPVLLLLFNL